MGVHSANTARTGTLVKEAALDGKYVRFSLMVFAPALVCIAAFACNCVVGSVVRGPRTAYSPLDARNADPSSFKHSALSVKSPKTPNTTLVRLRNEQWASCRT